MLNKYGYLLIAKPQDIQHIIQTCDEFVFIEGEGWWFKDPSKYLIKVVPLHERVETAILQVLHREHVASFDDVLQEIFKRFQNALTPNPPSVRAVLQEYADEVAGGKWRLKRVVEQREREHSEMIGYLAVLGKKAGFKVWIGLREQADTFEGKPLSTLCEKELKLPSVDPEATKNVQMIDVVWGQSGTVTYEFEVEHTTTITEALRRGSYIPPDRTKRFLVIPEERERLLFKKVNAPIFKDRIEQYKWSFIFYRDLREFYERNKRKKVLNPQEFDALRRALAPKKEKQDKLGRFI